MYNDSGAMFWLRSAYEPIMQNASETNIKILKKIQNKLSGKSDGAGEPGLQL
jgi:hypothetical protein